MIMSKTKESNQFIENINYVFKECVGHNSYGDATEFFDESGCVLMVASEQNGKTEIIFPGDGSRYEY